MRHLPGEPFREASLSAALLRGVMLHGGCPRRQAALSLGASGPYELGRGHSKKVSMSTLHCKRGAWRLFVKATGRLHTARA